MERSLARPFALVLCVSAATLLLVGAYVESLDLLRPVPGAPRSAPEFPCADPEFGPAPGLPQCSEVRPEQRTAGAAQPEGALRRRRT